MSFKTKLKATIAKLGFTEKAKAKQFTAEEQAAIFTAYEEDHGTTMEEDLKLDKDIADKAAAFDAIMSNVDFSATGDTAGDTASDPVEEEPKPPVETTPNAQAQAIIAGFADVNKTMANIAKNAQPDKPVDKVAICIAGGAHSPTHLFGIQHSMFAIDKRWNIIAKTSRIQSDPTLEDQNAFIAEFKKGVAYVGARVQELKSLGLITNQNLASVDYSSITSDSDLGTQYIVRRTDALISRIIAIPSLNHIFPLHSNVQNGIAIINAFLKDMSRSYKAGKVAKGGVKFEPEKAMVHDVMFKDLIESFKWIEESYLGYLNTSGSDPIKWNMIEWYIHEVSKKLQSERNLRAIQGYRVSETLDADAHYKFSAFGLVHTAIRYVENRQVLQFKDASLVYSSSADIGDVFESIMQEISVRVENPDQYALYANKKHRPMYKAWYNNKYGNNANYTGDKDLVPNHTNEIIWVPNMGNSKFVYVSIPGNLQQLENKPGEMHSISMQQDLESVWAWAVWKEGFTAAFAGVKQKTLEDLETADGKYQMLYLNWPETTLPTDATIINAKTSSDGMFVTGANTAAKNITDISNAEQGVVYRIAVGDITHLPTIDKAAKFDGLESDWAPTKVGEFLKVYWNGTKFIEVARG